MMMIICLWFVAGNKQMFNKDSNRFVNYSWQPIGKRYAYYEIVVDLSSSLHLINSVTYEYVYIYLFYLLANKCLSCILGNKQNSDEGNAVSKKSG